MCLERECIHGFCGIPCCSEYAVFEPSSIVFFVITSISFGVVINSSCTTRAKLNLLFKGVVPHRAQRMFQSGHACTLTRRYRNVLCFKGAQNKP